MAWTIAECYDIEFNTNESNQTHTQDYFQLTVAQKLTSTAHTTLSICDQRNLQLNNRLKKLAQEHNWHQVHLLLQLK